MKFFPFKIFRILKGPFDVKRSSDSKYLSLMSVARREVHEFTIFKHKKRLILGLKAWVKKVQLFFWLLRGKLTR